MLNDKTEGGLVRAILGAYRETREAYVNAGNVFADHLNSHPDASPPTLQNPDESPVGALLRVLERLESSNVRISRPVRYCGHPDAEFTVEWFRHEDAKQEGQPFMFGALIRHGLGEWGTHT